MSNHRQNELMMIFRGKWELWWSWSLGTQRLCIMEIFERLRSRNGLTRKQFTHQFEAFYNFHGKLFEDRQLMNHMTQNQWLKSDHENLRKRPVNRNSTQMHLVRLLTCPSQQAYELTWVYSVLWKQCLQKYLLKFLSIRVFKTTQSLERYYLKKTFWKHWKLKLLKSLSTLTNQKSNLKRSWKS